jgi:hypothetical protein
VGQWSDRLEAEAALQAMRASWRPVSFTVQRVFIITRRGFNAPFAMRWSVPLGWDGDHHAAHPSPLPPSQLDVSYVATVGGHPALPPPPPPPPLGLGETERLAADGGGGGGWNFSYGANMAPEKLTGARGLSPLQSKPGVLKHFRLAFTHRGAMGNVVVHPAAAAEGAEAEAEAKAKAKAARGLGEAGWGAMDGVHGVLHRLDAEGMAALTNMEHEYWPVEVDVHAYDGWVDIPLHRCTLLLARLDSFDEPCRGTQHRWLGP